MHYYLIANVFRHLTDSFLQLLTGSSCTNTPDIRHNVKYDTFINAHRRIFLMTFALVPKTERSFVTCVTFRETNVSSLHAKVCSGLNRRLR